jgi:hypothetical protein
VLSRPADLPRVLDRLRLHGCPMRSSSDGQLYEPRCAHHGVTGRHVSDGISPRRLLSAQIVPWPLRAFPLASQDAFCDRPNNNSVCMAGMYFHWSPLRAGTSRLYRVCCLPPTQPTQILSIQDGGRFSPSLLDLRLDHKQTRKDVNVRRAKRAIPWPFRYDITADTFNHRARQRRRYRSFLLMPASPDLGRMSC